MESYHEPEDEKELNPNELGMLEYAEALSEMVRFAEGGK